MVLFFPRYFTRSSWSGAPVHADLVAFSRDAFKIQFTERVTEEYVVKSLFSGRYHMTVRELYEMLRAAQKHVPLALLHTLHCFGCPSRSVLYWCNVDVFLQSFYSWCTETDYGKNCDAIPVAKLLLAPPSVQKRKSPPMMPEADGWIRSVKVKNAWKKQ